MKHIFLSILLVVISCSESISQNKNEMNESILETVQSFSQAIATRDIQSLDQLLHPEFRVVANRFNVSDQALVLSKPVYLQMMEDEKIGGTAYKLEIKASSTFQHTAQVQALFSTSEGPDMHVYLLLILNATDEWQIVSDVPVMVPK